MVEALLAWIMLFMGIVKGDPLYFIASGVFAVAIQISRCVEGDVNYVSNNSR